MFAAAAPGPDEGPLLNVARRLAGNSYARQHGLTRAMGHQLAFTVPIDKIRVHAATAGVMIDGIPKTYTLDASTGTYKGPLIDWIKAHPEQFAQIVKTIVMLISLFADNQPFPPAEFYVLVAPCNAGPYAFPSSRRPGEDPQGLRPGRPAGDAGMMLRCLRTWFWKLLGRGQGMALPSRRMPRGPGQRNHHRCRRPRGRCSRNDNMNEFIVRETTTLKNVAGDAASKESNASAAAVDAQAALQRAADAKAEADAAESKRKGADRLHRRRTQGVPREPVLRARQRPPSRSDAGGQRQHHGDQ